MSPDCCKHCPENCSGEHGGPPEIDCADCVVEMEECYADTLAV